LLAGKAEKRGEGGEERGKKGKGRESSGKSVEEIHHVCLQLSVQVVAPQTNAAKCGESVALQLNFQFRRVWGLKRSADCRRLLRQQQDIFN